MPFPSRHIHILTGSGDHEDPSAARKFSEILYNKGIDNEISIWGSEWKHDWPTWRAMLPLFIDTRF